MVVFGVFFVFCFFIVIFLWVFVFYVWWMVKLTADVQGKGDAIVYGF